MYMQGQSKCTYTHTHMHVSGDQRLIMGVFLSYSPPYFYRQGLSVNLVLVDWLDWLASEVGGWIGD